MIRFTSTLGPEQKPELERLLFFNGNQSRVVDGVHFVAQTYGIPRITDVEGRLRIVLGGKLELQSLYVFDADELIGVLAYTREDDSFVVLYVAVDEAYESRGSNAGRMLLVKMLRELETIARRVRGIAQLRVFLGRREPTRMAVRRLPAPGKSG
ncbi:MAG TPA: hypothetical protein VG755_38395 [Nannocystaceae bacterium]|nr:hypothetical protein [Nannocystaceae bacterium]